MFQINEKKKLMSSIQDKLLNGELNRPAEVNDMHTSCLRLKIVDCVFEKKFMNFQLLQ